MRHEDLPVALLAFLALVAVVPLWTHWTGAFEPRVPQHGAMAGMLLPVLILLFVFSWVSPHLTGPVLGGAMLLFVMMLAPWFWNALDLAANVLADGNPLAELLLTLALPVLVLVALAKLGSSQTQGGGARP